MEPEFNGILEQIHKDALRVLEEVGVKCVSKEVRSIFEETGLAAFDEDEGHIHILTPLIDQVLSTAPKRDQYWIPENSFGVGGTAPFVYDDLTGELVEPTFDHLSRIAAIVDEADVVQFMARGVLVKKQEVKVIDTIVENCTKPIYVAAITDEGIQRVLEVHQQRGGVTVQFSIINSPLNVIESMIDPFLSCVRKGIPIYVSTMPMAGLSGPYSMSGLVTLTHAEALFGIALAQLVNPGINKLTILPGRNNFSNSAEIVGSPAMKQLIKEMKHRYSNRYIIFDAPPAIDCPDTLILSQHVDGIILVTEYNKTTRDQIEKTLILLKNANILGTVLNKTGTGKKTGYY